MVRFFNEIGLVTKFSCQGHEEGETNDFYIMFENSVKDDVIFNFIERCSDGCLHTPLVGKFEKWVRKCEGKMISNWIYSVSYGIAAKNQRLAAQDFQMMISIRGDSMAEQRMCDICKKNLADMSFRVKRSNKRWGGLWSGYEDIDICNKCGKKLLDVVNYNAMSPVHPPSTGSSVEHKNWAPPISCNVPTSSHTPPRGCSENKDMRGNSSNVKDKYIFEKITAFDLSRPIYAFEKEKKMLVNSIHFPLGSHGGKDISVVSHDDSSVCEWRSFEEVTLIQRDYD
ncbi:MAG: hypothetical protein PHG19_04030 [Anaerotignum sp.]|nr:hypothetical protein [Anaerotignum sp.]